MGVDMLKSAAILFILLCGISRPLARDSLTAACGLFEHGADSPNDCARGIDESNQEACDYDD
jgi:hypothetical protein